MVSIHYKNDRISREEKIREIGQGKDMLTSIVYRHDKSYPYDIERQVVTSTGIIRIYNYYDDKLVTKLIARTGQIIRLYSNEYKRAPSNLIAIAREHESKGYHLL